MAIIDFASAPHTWSVRQLNAHVHTTVSAELQPYMLMGMALETGSQRLNNWVELAFVGQTDLWIQVHHFCSHVIDNDITVMTFAGGGTDLFRLILDSSKQFEFEQWNGSSWDSKDTSTTVMSGTLAKIDIHIHVNDSGTIKMYNDDVEILSFVGDTLETAQATLDNIRCNHTSSFATNNGGETVYSALIIADEDTRTIEMAEQVPTGNGNYTDWIGDFSNVDDVGEFDDATKINSAINADRETFTKTAIDANFDTGYDVISLAVHARARKGATGLNNMQLVTRSNSVDGDSSNIALSVGYATYKEQFLVDPDTASAWGVSAVESAEIGAEAVT